MVPTGRLPSESAERRAAMVATERDRSPCRKHCGMLGLHISSTSSRSMVLVCEAAFDALQHGSDMSWVQEQATGDGGCVGLAFLAQNDQLSFARSEIRRDSVGQDGRALSCQRSWLCICWQISPHFAARRVRPQLEPSPSSLGLKLTSMLLVQESGSDTLVSRCGRWWHSHGHPESREA